MNQDQAQGWLEMRHVKVDTLEEAGRLATRRAAGVDLVHLGLNAGDTEIHVSRVEAGPERLAHRLG